MSIEWTKNLESGIPAVDMQHKLLIKKTGELLLACKNAAGKEEAREMIDFLSAYCTEHFVLEENLMRESGYPYYLSHARQHRMFNSLILETWVKVDSEGVATDTVVRLNKALVSWFLEHIMKMDLKMCEYLSAENNKLASGT